MINRLLVRKHLGFKLSLFFHFSLLMLLLFNFPQCQKAVPKERIVSLDLLPIAKISNVENKQKAKPEKKEEKPAKVAESKKNIEEKIVPEEKPSPENKEQEKPVDKPISNDAPKLVEKAEEKIKKEAEPEPKKLEPAKVEKKPEVKKAPQKKQNTKDKPKKNKETVNEYDNILKNLLSEEQQESEVSDKKSMGKYDSSMPLSLSLKDTIKQQIEKCWSPPAGNKNAGSLKVLLHIMLKRNGEVENVKIIDSIKYAGDDLYKVAADAAVRAVYKCSPLENLPAEQYENWKNLEFNFDPTDILY